MSRRPGDLNNLLPPMSFFLAVFVIGIAIEYWPVTLIIAVVALASLVYTSLEPDPKTVRLKKPKRAPAAERAAYRHALRLREMEDIVERADQQHKWILEDDPRGIHGDYTPAVL